MLQLFKANGFIDYVSGMYLQNICRAANERFEKLTRHTMRLEMNEKNDFVVRDFLNDGQTRSIRTLSGGQIFQASLSLALALADNVRATTEMPQNFFFLDEGFGSLDRDSLKTVFETLKSLQKENRIVGIISHVEEMQLEIDRYLYINLNETEGSVIEMF
jgi:exonuclease SbcC